MDKRITVQYYANTKLKAKSILWKGELIEVFPLYARIIYDGNNTQIKADINGDTILVSEDLEQLKNTSIGEATREWKNWIEKILSTEIKKDGEEFSFKGIGHRISIYSQSVADVFGCTTLAVVDNISEGLLMDSKESMYGILAYMRQIDERITVFNWIYENGKQTYMKSIASMGSQEEAETFVAIVDKVLWKHLNE